MLRQAIAVGALVGATVSGSSVHAEDSYQLRYKLSPGQQLTYRVVHSAKTQVQMNGTEEASHVHTTSVRSWHVQEVTPEGEATFDHVIDSVVMTQQAGDQKEIRWDSGSNDVPPVQFKRVAERLGQVIDTIRINARGQVLSRTGKEGGNLGMGEIAMPLPEGAAKIGERWSVPRDVRVKNSSGTLKIIKIRELYTLEKVQAGVATISVRSEPLTPIDDQTIRSQLVQQLSSGTIEFDFDAGHVIKRELNWEDEVVGFQGPSSNMEYNARLTEQIETSPPQTARRETTKPVK